MRTLSPTHVQMPTPTRAPMSKSMQMPVFQEYEPADDCVCPGCTQRRRALARARAIPLRDGGHPAARGARRALVLATAAGVVLAGGGSAALAMANPVSAPGPGIGSDSDPDSGFGPGPMKWGGPDTPQGGRAPLHGRKGRPSGAPGAPAAVKRIDRTTIINRAKLWLDAEVPYSMSDYWTDGYRQDCSGYVSMAWNLGTNEWTGSLDKFATKITKAELLPGDMLLFHNPSNPTNGSHVVIFGGWADETQTSYIAYEQTRPSTRKLATPYGYWTNPAKYVPYRFTGVTGGIVPEDPAGGAKPGTSTEFPGADKFGPGADNEYVKQLGKMLIDRGGRRFYPKGASSKWSDADRLATQAFQQAQGWTGADADGTPGAYTWQLLVENTGQDIRPTVEATPGPGGVGAYPGAMVFRPGSTHAAVATLGRLLVEKGFGKYYTSGTGFRWTEADRRAVEAFQRAQGWRGAQADGYPGPETWRRLFV